MCDRRNDGKDIVDKSDEDVVDGDDVGVHKSDNDADVSAGGGVDDHGDYGAIVMMLQPLAVNNTYYQGLV